MPPPNHSVTKRQAATWAFILFMGLLSALNSFGQQMTRTSKKTTNSTFTVSQTERGDFYYLLRGKTITFDNRCSYVNQSLSPIAKTSNDEYLIDKPFHIDSCHFKSTHASSDLRNQNPCNDAKRINIVSNNSSIPTSITNSDFDKSLSLMQFKGDLAIDNNRTPNLDVSISSGSNITISGNKLSENKYSPFAISIQVVKSTYLTIANNTFYQDSSRIMISLCSAYEISLHNNKAKYLETLFTADTLLNVSLTESMPEDFFTAKPVKKIQFSSCIVRGPIKSDLPQSNSTITFKRCRFNSDAQLVISNTDTLFFDNCIFIEKGMQLKGSSKAKKIVLKFNNTDITNIDFNYDDHFILHRWKDNDMTKSVYEKLLVKFQDEKRFESLKKVDIEYFKFRHGTFVNTLSFLWWNFGYDKWIIICWTIW
jgi:hypothetical protein